ncbi:MAG TPA: plastocyanin/azurin family copper-binding protein [Actinomycetota bacterium]|jgi:plastocyanin|nr:plastocyanin/azurin family copper-binding protein [Actinomycetota bacterium]
MRRLAVVAVLVASTFLVAQPAFAPHLFPLAPGDPTGDCAARMQEPSDAAAHVVTEGFFFLDERTMTSTTTIKAGQSVMWEFIRFCHSVTSVSVPKGAKKFSTYGGKGSATGPVMGQDQLVKPDGAKSNYTVKFRKPGRYSYECIHHAAVGMTGTIVVTR